MSVRESRLYSQDTKLTWGYFPWGSCCTNVWWNVKLTVETKIQIIQIILAKTIVSIFQKEVECKLEKLSHMKLELMQLKIIWTSSTRINHIHITWSVTIMINDFSLSFKNKERGGEWGFIFFLSERRKGRLIRGSDFVTSASCIPDA